MNKSPYLLLLFCFQITNLFAQEIEISYGEIPTEELAMETYSPDSTASAVILNDIAKIDFSPLNSGSYTLNRHCRIKVFEPNNFNFKDVAIRYLKTDDSDWQNAPSAIAITGRIDTDRFLRTDDYDSQNLQAAIITPDGNRIELTKAEIFEERVFGKVYAKMLALTDLQPGSVIEYKYQVTSANIITLQDWYFQNSIPTRHSELEIKLPNWLEYDMIMQGNIEPTRKDEQRVRYNYSGFNYPELKVRYIFKGVPAIQSEPYITTIDNYRAGIKFHLQRVKLYRRMAVEYLTSWDDLVDELLKRNERFAKLYQKKNAFSLLSKDISPLLVGKTSEREKAQIIYDYVNQNMKWNGDYSILGSELTLNKIYKQREGSSADLNFMVAALLQQAKIEFTPIVLSTRQNGKTYPLQPFLAQFNHVILQANLDGETVLIDATGDQFLPLGMIRKEALNKIGWRVKQKAYTWAALEPAPAIDVFIANFNLSPTGILTGQLQSIQTGYSALEARKLHAEDNDRLHISKELSEQFTDVEIGKINYKNLAAYDKELYSKFDLTITDAIEIDNDLMYFSPIIHSDFFENPFQLATRNYPIDFPYPIEEQFVTTINLPEGYQIESLPKKALLKLPADAGSFQYLATKENNSIKLVSELVLNQLLFEPTEYQTIKEFFDLVATKLKKQVVLKKITTSDK